MGLIKYTYVINDYEVKALIIKHIKRFNSVLTELKQKIKKFNNKINMKEYLKKYKSTDEYKLKNIEYVNKHRELNKRKEDCLICNGKYVLPQGIYIHNKTTKHIKALQAKMIET